MFDQIFVKRRLYSIELDDGTILSVEDDESRLKELYDKWLENKCVDIYRKWKEQGTIVLDKDFNISMERENIKDSQYFKFKRIDADDISYVISYLGGLPKFCRLTDISLDCWLSLTLMGYGAFSFTDIEKHANNINHILDKCRNSE